MKTQKGRIFISYRRADSEGYAGRIYDRLAPYFGDDAIFMDVDDIPAGVDFVKFLENEVQACDVLIALIGRQWLNVKDEHGNRRLDNPTDFVRIEIATALRRDIRVIPVLLGGTQMPHVSELPDNLQSLTRRNGLPVYHHSFHADSNRLIKHLEDALATAERARKEQQEKEHKEKEEREAAEKAEQERIAREKREAEEKARLEKEAEEERERKTAAQKAHQEKIAREKRETEEKARQDALNKERQQERIENIKKNLPLVGRLLGIIFGFGLIVFVCYGIINIDSFINSRPETTELSPTPISSSPVVAVPTSTYLSIPAKTTIAPTALVATDAVTVTYAQTATVTPKPTLGVGSTMILDKDDMVMVYIPSGEFEMGNTTGDFDEQPVHKVKINAFWMTQTEITNAMYYKCFIDKYCKEPYRTAFFYDTEYANHPVTYVSWNNAFEYCEWVGGRLPTEAEWEYAARGGLQGKEYSWGDTKPVCEEDVENGARFNDSLQCNAAGTETVGTYLPNGYGLYDVVGNVWEWVADLYDVEYYKFSPEVNPPGPEKANPVQECGFGHIVRGGSWVNDDLRALRISNRQVSSCYFSYGQEIGFRCAMDASE